MWLIFVISNITIHIFLLDKVAGKCRSWKLSLDVTDTLVAGAMYIHPGLQYIWDVDFNLIEIVFAFVCE